MNHDDDIEWARQRMQAAIDDSNHAIERAREAEAKLANLLRQWSAVVEAAGLSPMLDDADGSRMTEALVRYLQPTPLPRSPCCNAAVRCGRCGDEFARRSPPINVTAPDPLAQLNALVKAGPVEIEEVDHKAGGKMISAMHLVRATGYEYMSDHRTLPETIDRLAQEVAKDQRKPDGYDPGAREVLPPDPFEDLQEALSDARRAEREATKPKEPTPIPLEVGQRWVRGEDPKWDAIIIGHDIDTSVRFRQASNVDLTHRWSEASFRAHHPRLRDPSEPEPPKPSLPVLPNTCGECEHCGPCSTEKCTTRGCDLPECRHPGNADRLALMSLDRLPPDNCPLRTTKPKETT